MKTLNFTMTVILMIATCNLSGQVAINTDGSSADPSAMLDVKSSDKGLLTPRMTQYEIATILDPANGLIVYNTDDCKFYVYRDCSTNWTEITLGTITISPWSCGDDIIDERDGSNYTTVQIGSQCWMAENMNYSTANSWCYNNIAANCNTYGRLYTWQTATIACPAGWHLPSDNDWCVLENEVDIGTVSCITTGWRGTDAGTNLKSISGWYNNGNGLDIYGFTTLPGGYRSTNTTFNNMTENILFWTSSDIGVEAWTRDFYHYSDQIYRYAYPKGSGLGVRCLKD